MASLDGTKTHENLKEAFAGESQANRRYLWFAQKADVEGYPDVAALFRSVAEGETGHAHGHLEYPAEVGDPASGEPIGDTEENLKASVAGETYEYTTMYPEFAAQARSDGDGGAEAEFNEQIDESKEHAGIFRPAAKNFGLLAPIEQHHAERYGVALEALQGSGIAGETAEPVAGQWMCKLCSMIYDPGERDPESGIAHGTPVEAIHDEWNCPACGASKDTSLHTRDADPQTS